LEAVFGDFTQDRLRLHFHTDSQPGEPPRQRTDPFPAFDCIALISGGVDSFVGGLVLLDGGRQPLGLSHTAAGAITQAQARVAEVLAARLQDFERVGLTAQKYGPTFPQPEPSQRSRSMLFLSMASIAASVAGTRDVFINENGVMAIHVPMTAARVGSLSTHTASPSVLERLQALLSDVLEAPIEIHNNLLERTKPEVVDISRALGGEADLASTVSCWSIGRTHRHCGTCAPCLMRRISFELHGVADVAYEADAFDDADVLQNEFACDNLTHLVRVVRDLGALPDLDLQLNYPELLNGGTRLSPSQTIDLHRRWAREADAILATHPVPAGLQ
jgi:7-cyano-7-deazaguanine synthase in queuosine biosynthesis